MKKELVREIIYCLNQLPNQKLRSEKWKNTYELINELEKLAPKEVESKWKQLQLL